jgi:hypothetical protein
MRNLREYESVANREHFCDRCCHYIQTGDLYHATVLLDEQKHRVVVFKTHHHPDCPPGWEDEEHERTIEAMKDSSSEPAEISLDRAA